MDVLIRNRNPKWEDKRRIKALLSDLQKIVAICRIADLPAEYFADIVYFVLDQFPVREGCVVNGNVSNEWIEFEDKIPDYSIDEFYERVMHPCNYKEEEK